MHMNAHMPRCPNSSLGAAPSAARSGTAYCARTSQRASQSGLSFNQECILGIRLTTKGQSATRATAELRSFTRSMSDDADRIIRCAACSLSPVCWVAHTFPPSLAKCCVRRACVRASCLPRAFGLDAVSCWTSVHALPNSASTPSASTPCSRPTRLPSFFIFTSAVVICSRSSRQRGAS